MSTDTPKTCLTTQDFAQNTKYILTLMLKLARSKSAMLLEICDRVVKGCSSIRR